MRYNDGIPERMPTDLENQRREYASRISAMIRDEPKPPRRYRRVRPAKHPVLLVETGQVFDSITLAAAAIGCSFSSVSHVVCGKRPAFRGLHFRYVR